MTAENPFDDPDYIDAKLREYNAEINARAIPMRQRIAAAREQLADQEEKIPGRLMADAGERRRNADAARRRLIEESNGRDCGEPDSLGNLHQVMQRRFKEGEREKIYRADQRYEQRVNGTPHRRNGWGTYHNQTRAEFCEEVARTLDRQRERDINSIFEEAEEPDRT